MRLPEDISAYELEVAAGGPLAWPDTRLMRVAYFCWLLDRLRGVVPHERLEQAILWGRFASGENADLCHDANRDLARLNTLNLAAGWPAGAEGVKRLLKTPVEDWPFERSRYPA